MSVWPEGFAPEIPAAWAGPDGFVPRVRYLELFEAVLEPFDRALGLPPDYLARTNCSTFALESHVVYLDDARPGERLLCRFHFADADEKRVHYLQTLHRAGDGPALAAYECLCMHVDLGLRRGLPFPEAAAARAADRRGAPPAALARRPPPRHPLPCGGRCGMSRSTVGRPGAGGR